MLSTVQTFWILARALTLSERWPVNGHTLQVTVEISQHRAIDVTFDTRRAVTVN